MIRRRLYFPYKVDIEEICELNNSDGQLSIKYAYYYHHLSLYYTYCCCYSYSYYNDYNARNASI